MIESPYKEKIDRMRWSYSRLHTYATCPAAFKKIYLDNEEQSENAFAQYGTVCHSILEDYEKGELAEYELAEVFEDRWGKEVTCEFPSTYRYGSMGDRYFEDGLRYFSAFDGFPENWDIVGAEIDAEFEYKGHQFLGFIDLLVRDKNDGKLIVVDHKSKKGFKGATERDEYAIQLYLYSKYVYDNYGEYPKQLIFNMFRTGEFVKVDFDIEKYRLALDWATAIIESIYQDVDFWDKILLKYESEGKDIDEYKYNDFFCWHLCGCRKNCERSAEGVHVI